MHIPLGHREIRVTGEFLNGPCWGSSHRKMRAERVSQDMHADTGQACAA